MKIYKTKENTFEAGIASHIKKEVILIYYFTRMGNLK